MIIHSPTISGSLIFAEGATFTLPDGGIYSGSFSGSIQVHNVQSHIIPDTPYIYDLGSEAFPFRDLYLSTASIWFGDNGKMSFGSTSTGFSVSDDNGIAVPFVASKLSLAPANFEPISFTSFGGGFAVVNTLTSEPAPAQFSKFTLKQTSASSGSVAIPSNGGVSFLNVGESQCTFYFVDNVSLSENLDISFTDCNGDPQTSTVNANTNNHEVQAQEGSIVRTGGSDNYRIKLDRYIGASSAPIEVAKLTVTGSTGGGSITPTVTGVKLVNPADETQTVELEISVVHITGSNGEVSIGVDSTGTTVFNSVGSIPAQVQMGNITISGSNGTSTITNDLPGEGLAVTDATGSVQPIKVKQVDIVDSVTGDVVQLTVVSGSLNTTATNSSGSAIANPKSNLSGSFTGSLTLTGDIITDSGDCIKIGTIANPVCEIHATDITGSIAATNGVISGSSQVNADSITNFDTNVKDKLNTEGVISGSSQVSLSTTDVSEGTNLYYTDARVKTKLNTETVVSGSTQILTLVSIDEDNMTSNSDTKLPTQQSVKSYVDTQVSGLVDSAPGALDTLNELAAALGDDANFSTTLSNTIAGKVSQSLEVISGDGLTGGGNLTTNRTIAVDGTVLRTTGFGVVSGSSQVNADSITNFDSNVKTKLNADGVISGSSQVSLSTTDVSEGTNLYYTDARVKTKLNTETVISGSSQVDVTATTGYSTISSHILNTSNPHSVTAAQVGLGNVTNESKTTMFSSPTFTGTVSGVTKAHVGLGNVDNESKATMFTNAALTGNPTAPTQTGTDDSTKIATTAFVQGRIDAVIGNAGAALDTLGELSASLAQDSGSLASLVTTVGGKLQKDQNLLDLTDVAQARTNLGVDAAGTDNSTDVTLAGSYDYLTISGQVITRNQIDASTDISNLNTTNVSEGSNLYYTDARVKTKLTAEGVISSSAQITITESQISDLDHYTDSDFDARLATKSTTNLSEGTNLYYTDTRVKTKLTAEDVVSGSATQVRSFLNVENGATADQTGAEIKSLYEGEANTNAFTDTLLSKLNGIEAGATADQSAEEIQDIVGAMLTGNTETGITVTYQDTDGTIDFVVATQSDENFTFALLSKLNGIEALADVTDATNVDAAGAVMNSDTSTAAMSFVIDEDTMASNLATKVPTQQSVKTYVDGKVAGLVDSAPGALDTLNELAAALGDDANFSTTVTNSLAGKAANTITISAGNGLSGGGNLTANRTLSMSGTYTGDFAVTGNITATADIVAYASSDERLKKNIELISDPIGKIKQLKGVTWVWKDEASDVAKQSPNVGVIAQDVEKVLPQVVKDRENGYKGVDYGKMVGLLIEAIKDQQKQIDELRSRLK